MIFNETAKTCQRRAIEIDVMGEISLTCLFTKRNRQNKTRLLWEYLTFFYFYFEVFKTPCPLFHPRVKTQGLHCFFFLLNYPFMTYSWSNICLHCEKLPKTNVLKKLNPSIYIPVIKIYNSYSLNCIWYLLPAALLTAEYLSQKKLLKWSLGQSTTLTVDG